MKAETLVYLEKRFEKLRKLHQTAKGEVWLATDMDGKPVVWKTIQLTGLPYAAIKKISHPLLPEIIHVAEDEESTIVIEEYVQGRPLSELVARKKFLKEAEVRSILLQLCSGLALLHRKGIIHRDIKPSNLILQKNGDVRLIDFDAARVVKENGEEDTHLLGTRGYAPPEQFGYGQTDARSDIYSLGIILSNMPGNRFRKVARKCCRTNPSERYGSVQEVREALGRNRIHPGAGLAAAAVVLLAIFLPKMQAVRQSPSRPQLIAAPDSATVPVKVEVIPAPVDTSKRNNPTQARPVPKSRGTKPEAKPEPSPADAAAIDELFRQATELFD